MGLQKDLTVFDEIVIPSVYIKIKTTIVEWETNAIKYVMGAWMSREASKNGKPDLPLGEYQEFHLEMPKGAEGGAKADQYQMIKTAIPFFSDCKDIFEDNQEEEAA